MLTVIATVIFSHLLMNQMLMRNARIQTGSYFMISAPAKPDLGGTLSVTCEALEEEEASICVEDAGSLLIDSPEATEDDAEGGTVPDTNDKLDSQSAVPWIRFDEETGELVSMGGLRKHLEGLKPPICFVALVGPGRTGKSTMAARLACRHLGFFPLGHTQEPVTEGIDAGSSTLTGDESECSSVVFLDCEGSNNPLAKSRREVGTLALSLASVVLDVGYGSIDDSLLQDLSALIASRRLLQLPDDCRAPAHLVLLVNNIRRGFNYTQKFDKLLESQPGETARNQDRKAIAEFFPQRDLFTTPDQESQTYELEVEKLRAHINEHLHPLAHDGLSLSGGQAADFVEAVVEQLNARGSVETESIFSQIILQSLQAEAGRVAKRYSERMKELSQDHWIRDLNLRDPASNLLAEFDNQVAHITASELVTQVREGLQSRMAEEFSQLLSQNDLRKQREEAQRLELNRRQGVYLQAAFLAFAIIKPRLLAAAMVLIVLALHFYRIPMDVVHKVLM
eukprot:gnl/MRDRNA2_/MRDRNA2_305048_c0_seq1.p1 gnl/MRDRNA2_/MRDRNA2_305048_c0~~gnl/MRDRNA2_/MRDRNA2_305048_c0_seq1.p1  ORF type:complete len:509 (-),score=85.27 gnl/MRDRNA2_/MRDRNA2_305048_c0_seq1:208-1734(-)